MEEKASVLMELISVIVPVYNVEQYLLRCVDSIRKQTYQNLEIILVDDDSPDRCPQMCEELAEVDQRIKVIHKENGGLGFARNSGLDIATGEYVVFIDSDDWISENHIENLYLAAKEHHADVVIGSYTRAFATGELRERSLALQPRCYEGEEVHTQILLRLLGPDQDFPRDVQLEPSCATNMYRMKVIQANKLRFTSEREAISEDIYFNAEVYYRAKSVVLVNERGYFYFENQSSLSKSYNAKMFDRILKYYEVIKAQVATYGLGDAVAFRLERTFLMKVRVAMRMAVISNLPKREKRHLLREMLSHPVVQAVLETYPIHMHELTMRILMKQMKKKHVLGVSLCVRLREMARIKGVLKTMLNGIRPQNTQY